MGGLCATGDDTDNDEGGAIVVNIEQKPGSKSKTEDQKEKEYSIIQETKMDRESIVSNEMHVGLFYDAFLKLQFAGTLDAIDSDNVNQTEEELVANQQGFNDVNLVYFSLLKQGCMGDGYMAPSEKAYLESLAKQWRVSDEDIEQAFAHNADIKDYPMENNPFMKFKSFGKDMTQDMIGKYVLFHTLVASAQDGLQNGELDVIYGYADELNVEREVVDEFIRTMQLEQELFLRWKKLL